MIDKQIEQLGQLTKRAIEKSSESIQADLAGQVVDIETKRQEVLALLEKEVSEIDSTFSERLQQETEKLQATHKQEIETIKQQLAKYDSLAGLVEKEVNNLDAAFAERLEEEREQLAQKIVNQQVTHDLEIDLLKQELTERKELEIELAERIASIRDGDRGEQGCQGEPGIDGQDRPLLEPVCLQDKDYPKSTLGTFAGGLWISTKQTTGNPDTDAHAWHCVLDAMETMQVELQEDHTFGLKLRMATGKVIEDTFRIPFPEHKGIYEQGQSYAAGQIVTKGSCFWLAMEDTAGTPPGNGWQQILSAPRGKAGPAGKSITGPQGKPGRNGRDANLDDEFIADLREIVAQYRGQSNA